LFLVEQVSVLALGAVVPPVDGVFEIFFGGVQALEEKISESMSSPR
jgi:hypothetical protein